MGKVPIRGAGIVNLNKTQIKYFDNLFEGVIFTALANLNVCISININCESLYEEVLHIGWVDAVNGKFNFIGECKINGFTKVQMDTVIHLKKGLKFFIVLAQTTPNSDIHIFSYWLDNNYTFNPKWYNVIDFNGL